LKRLICTAALLLALLPAPARAQHDAALAVAPEAAPSYRAVLRLQDGLADSELENAVHSGLPLRIRFRVELWKDAFIDQQLGAEEWTMVLTFDPLSELYIVRTRGNTGTARAFAEYRTARNAVEAARAAALRPTAAGRYYYTASVDIETLSLSDLDELERWLRGELQPAVTGDRSLPGAIGQGARRLFMRVLSLPERRFEARSARFQLP
jgi:hypothetical protein